MKNNKGKLLVSSIVILLPILVGLVLWNQLPDQIATHWGIQGKVDGWSSPLMAVFVLPLFMLFIHWMVLFFIMKDPGNKEQNKKIVGMTYWICPIISLFSSGVIYSSALGKEFDSELVPLVMIGLMFVVIGNYLPKCKHNYTIGIKIPWTLNDEENWNMTHRFGGKVWVIGGIILLLSVFLPELLLTIVLVAVLFIMIILPTAYSYLYYRKQVKEGKEIRKSKMEVSTTGIIISIGITIVILVATAILLFTGDIDIKYEDTEFKIEADYWGNLKVAYEDITNVEYREEGTPGKRTNGFGSPRLLMGSFKNDEFGYYTRYSYTKCGSCVVIELEEEAIVLSAKDAQSTEKIYEELVNRVNMK